MRGFGERTGTMAAVVFNQKLVSLIIILNPLALVSNHPRAITLGQSMQYRGWPANTGPISHVMESLGPITWLYYRR